ncbi:MAG: hypothetical protein J6V11_04425 [Alphaproteobacteria bacterium]|nr:hypothetical protein [Alphaproteobacteria bacterium]
MSNYFITYEQVEQAAFKASTLIKKQPVKINRLVAISRGGLVPACLLAEYLDIREIHALSLYSYRPDGTQGDVTVLVRPDVPDTPDTLFVDDLVDGGKTAEYIKQAYPNASFLPLFSKKISSDYVVNPTLVPENASVIFPWEPDFAKKRARER